MRTGTPKTTIQTWEHRRGGVSQMGPQRPRSVQSEEKSWKGKSRSDDSVRAELKSGLET